MNLLSKLKRLLVNKQVKVARQNYEINFYAFHMEYRDPETHLDISTEFVADGKLIFLTEALNRATDSEESRALLKQRLETALQEVGIKYVLA
jgi:hypothetical protein